jgi:putative Mg2+ transporter-C (MgtC) family protein
MFETFEVALSIDEFSFVIALLLSVVAGYMIGAEREARHKDAGIGTHILVILGSMLFTYLSMRVDPESTSRIAAQIVSGIGFLGAGLIIKEGVSVRNLTTAAILWFAAAIGMCFGFGPEYFLVGVVAALCATLVPRLPHFVDHSTCASCGTKIGTDDDTNS